MRDPQGYKIEQVANELRKGQHRLRWEKEISDGDLKEYAQQLGQILNAKVKWERVRDSRTMAFFHVVKKRKKGGKQ